MGLRLGMVAGEVSGDLLGAGLLEALRQRGVAVDASGIGGDAMCAAGFSSQAPMHKLSVMGLLEVLRHLPELIGIRLRIGDQMLHQRPDVFIGIDSPDFNLALERRLREAGIKTVHYVSPTIWAWRQKRIRRVAEAVDLVLTLFPFESDFYRDHGLPVAYVGHPLADRLAGAGERRAAMREQLGLASAARVLAVLPGSRGSELGVLGRPFAATIANCLAQDPALEVIAPMASRRLGRAFSEHLRAAGVDDRVQLIDARSHDAMIAADAVLLASGTAALEAMLIGRPMVVAYGFSRLTYFMLMRTELAKMNFYSLPNILAGEALVPEFIQDELSPAGLTGALESALSLSGDWPQTLERFEALSGALRCGANERAADAILELAASA